MATNAQEIVNSTVDEDASDWALAENIATEFLKDETPERDSSGKFRPKEAKESETVTAKAETDEDAAPEKASGEDVEDTEPETPAIEPPLSWTADAKEAFSKLPPELQNYVQERESEREKGINAKLSETAELRKKYETEATATQQERQKYAENLQAVLAYAQTMDPILAEGMRTDWAKAAQEDPIGTQAKWFAFQQRREVMQAMQQEASRVMDVNAKTMQEQARKKLQDAFPDFADEAKAKAKKDSFAPILMDAGLTQAEIDGFWQFPDPRYIKILSEALEGRQIKIAQKTIALKKAAQAAPKVARPKGTDDGKSKVSSRVEALSQRAAKTDTVRDLTNYIMAALEEG